MRPNRPGELDGPPDAHRADEELVGCGALLAIVLELTMAHELRVSASPPDAVEDQPGTCM